MPSQMSYFVSLIASYGLLVTVSFSSTHPPPPLQPGQNSNNNKKQPYYVVAFKMER